MGIKKIIIIHLVGLISVFAIAGNKKVLIIGVDGCRPDALLAANTPNIDKIWKNGAYSFTAQTDEISSSGICWTGMLTGVWHNKHKVVSNAYKNPNVKEYPHFFRRIKEQQPELITASIVNWKPIHNILQDGDADIQKRRLFDWWVTCKTQQTIKRKKMDVLFVALDEVDHAGHVHGFSPDSSNYLLQIEKADQQVGKIIAALKKRKNYQHEDWLVIITTDHGGSEYGHGKDIPEHTTIFYIAEGASINKGKIESNVNVIDVAVTALNHLGIDIKDKWKLDGKAVGLK